MYSASKTYIIYKGYFSSHYAGEPNKKEMKCQYYEDDRKMLKH